MRENWHRRDSRGDPKRRELWRDPEHGTRSRPFRHGRDRDEERWGRRGDEAGEGAWFAEALQHSNRYFHGGGGRALARRIEELGSFDPYENAPPFRNRSGQEEWPGGRRSRDEAGRFRGKGPRGYKRSDDRIAEDVNDRLTEDPWLDASGIEVSVSNGEVTLGGFVSSRLDKRRAEDCADGVPGVSHVQNNLRARPASLR
ncbi:hypothetical protein AU381_18665 [Sinorhizobium glycinis]|uniref:BON domain-containing protein n=1 Tax=Sinorhizobium glycinis TaxID=1472378 RepID=A0A178XMU7_9HYPH|nr:BON domain-containing protein [Sinorhizobium glycinis]OAP36524.1 hypothetical protein AU381_18665 [Sinorhizobium glycinis]